MKKFFAISGILIVSGTIIAAAGSYFGFLWAVNQAEVKILQQLNAQPHLKAKSLKINLENKVVLIEEIQIDHDQIQMTIPELTISTERDFTYLVSLLQTRKLTNIEAKFRIPEFHISQLRLSPKKSFSDIKGHLHFEVDLNQSQYKINISDAAIDKVAEGTVSILFERQALNLNLSKQIQKETKQLIQKNIQGWDQIKILEVSGHAKNQGLAEMVIALVQIEQKKLNSLMQTGIQLLSAGKPSEGEKLSKDILTSAYYFLNSPSDIGFSLKPSQGITPSQVLNNLQSKTDLGFMDLGISLWVKK
ncbi:MAG: hypothetical protein ACK5P5_05515 [Pseudobdellovibrionaceae bacterium]